MLVDSFSNDYPKHFRVVPAWAFKVEMVDGARRYRLGGETGPDVTSEVLHIRYKSTTDGAHGVGPLSAAGGRMLTAGILAKYVRDVAATGGVVTSRRSRPRRASLPTRRGISKRSIWRA